MGPIFGGGGVKIVEPADRDYVKEVVAAGVAALAAGIATFAPGELPKWISATVTALAGIVGWTLGRIATHRTHRVVNAVTASVLAALAFVLVILGPREPCAPKGITCLVGGCDRYSVYAQNRYVPLGTAIRAEPRGEGTQVGSSAGNKLLPVDGWVRTAAPYPHNGPPFDSNIWFHLADDSGWVSFAGVRGEPTTPAADPFDDIGGTPAPAPKECNGTFRSNS